MIAGNKFDRMEWAGAFGDLGTLLPFVIAYIAVVKIEPFDILFAFGLAQLFCGLYYRTPFPVQPMKAIGAVAATQAAQTAVITSSTVIGATFATGLLWLILGLSGVANWVSRWVPRFVTVGIILGLGFSFMLEGTKMMAQGWWIAAPGLLGAILLLPNKRIPAMFLLLIYGALCGLVRQPELRDALMQIRPALHLPHLALWQASWRDLALGTVLLALPQLPLTLGNAVIAIEEENNRLFRDRPVTENGIACSTGVMNLLASLIGGVPMCHGAGGMAGHVAFGARTGGAPMILGGLLLLTALLFSDSISTIFQIFPRPILGVILFLTGIQLALGSCDLSKNKGERFISLLTAALSIWNVAVAFLAGLALTYLHHRKRLRL